MMCAIALLCAVLGAGEARTLPVAEGLNGTVSVTAQGATYVRTAEGTGDSGFSLTWTLPDWDDDAYVFLPSCAYNGNRDFTFATNSYPPKFEVTLVGKADARVVMDIPRLNPDGSGSIEVTTGDVATPCVGVFFPRRQKGLLIFTQQQVGGKNIGYAVSKGRIAVSFPANRRDAYRFHKPHPQNADRPLALASGARLEVPFETMDFSARDIPAFLEVFFRNRQRFVSGRRIPAPYTAEVMAAVESGINRDSWRKAGYWAEGTTGHWTVGWVGGMPTAWGMLAGGRDPLSRERATQVPDWLVANQNAFGLYLERWESGEVGHLAGDNRLTAEIGCDYQLLRRSAEGLFFLLRYAERIPLRESWRASARKASDAFVRMWRTYGEWAMFAEAETGRPVISGSAGAALVPAALVRAYRLFGTRAYLDVALESAGRYYADYVAKGISYGGPNEALTAPDSESAAVLLESLVTVAEETRDPVWIRRARDAAHLFSTWVVSYPYVFPEASEFGRLKINTTGAVFANCQNKHAAPGICSGSGEALYRLYKLTGDVAYRDLCRDVAAFIPQTVSTAARPICDWETHRPLAPGWINERVNMSDWEGEAAVGGVFYGTCWCTAAFMCTCADLIDKPELDLKPKP